MAIEDAATLAEELVAGDTVEAALAAYSARRYPRVQFAQKASRDVLDAGAADQPGQLRAEPRGDGRAPAAGGGRSRRSLQPGRLARHRRTRRSSDAADRCPRSPDPGALPGGAGAAGAGDRLPAAAGDAGDLLRADGPLRDRRGGRLALAARGLVRRSGAGAGALAAGQRGDGGAGPRTARPLRRPGDPAAARRRGRAGGDRLRLRRARARRGGAALQRRRHLRRRRGLGPGLRRARAPRRLRLPPPDPAGDRPRRCRRRRSGCRSSPSTPPARSPT